MFFFFFFLASPLNLMNFILGIYFYLFLSISPIFQITFSRDELGIKNEIKVQRQDDFKE
jgi:hypothetical protein